MSYHTDFGLTMFLKRELLFKPGWRWYMCGGTFLTSQLKAQQDIGKTYYMMCYHLGKLKMYEMKKFRLVF